MKSCNLKKYMALAMSLLIMVGAAAVFDTEISFAAAKKPAKVKLTSAKRSGTKIILKWKKAKNAKKYQVYQKIGTGRWTLKKTLKKLTLTVKGTYGKAYSFKVRGVNGKKKGAFSAVKKVTIPKKTSPKPQPEPEPDPQPEPDEEYVTVYITLSDDSDFVIGNDKAHTPIARVPVKLSYVDLAKYGLERFYRHPADSFEDGGNYNDFTTVLKKPTAMMLIIKALEKWYLCREITPEDVGTEAYTLTGSPTSTYMSKLWGHDENLMYFVNHEYPLQRAGWGATSDYILMEDGDQLEIGMFSDWSFYGRGGFAFFDQDNPQINVGEELTLTMASNGTSAAQNGTTVNPNKPFPYEDIRVSEDGGRTWQQEVYKTDHEGKFTCMFEKPGVYYLSAGPRFVRQGESEPCIAPPVAVVEVAPGAIEEYRVRAISSTTARYSWGKIEGAVSYTVAYRKNGASEWTTVTTDKTEIDIKGLQSGAKYNFKVFASSESDYVPEGDPVKILKGDYSDISSVTMP